MKRVAIITAALAFIAATAPANVSADAGCDAVVADLPVLTDNIQTEWVTQGCSPNYEVRVTLSEFTGGAWNRADCPSRASGECTKVHPVDAENPNCDPFYCDGSNHHDTDNWNQDGGPCSRLWRTKVTVYRPNGDVIAVDTSPANTC